MSSYLLWDPYVADLVLVAYRLYTVVPRLLDLIEELTNWYIRFNRTRLKGENGHDDTVAALNTLFETLYTLCLTLVSPIPTAWETRLTRVLSHLSLPSPPRTCTTASFRSHHPRKTRKTTSDLYTLSCIRKSERNTLTLSSNVKSSECRPSSN